AYTAQRRDVYLCAKRRGVPGERFSFVPAARSCIMFLSLLSWPTKRKAGISRRNPRGRLHLARHRFVPGVETLETRTVPNGGYVFSTLDAPNAGASPNGFQGTFPVGINASGQISGNYGDANNVVHGFLLSHGRYTTLDDPNAGTAAFQGTNAFGLNAGGQIVGEYIDTNNVQHGFLLSGGQYTTIDNPNAGTAASAFDQAVNINARGQIVGGYTDANGVTHGYLLSGGQYTTVDDPNGVFNFALGINALGQIAGNYIDANNVEHGFLLSGGQYTTFDDPNGMIALVGMINDSGQIVRAYLDANNVFHSFLLSGGQYTTLDEPNAGTGAFQGSFALGINDSEQIVGFYYDALSVIHGYLATPARGDSAVDAARPANLDSASGTVNVLVAAAALHRATPLGNLAVCPTSTSGTNHGDSL